MVELPGLHRVRMKLASGFAEYWYAWRGGPRILSEKAASKTALAAQVRRAQPKVTAAYLAVTRHSDNASGFIAGLLADWQDSPEFAGLGERTKADLRKHLAVVSKDLGDLPLEALKANDARLTLMEWRKAYAAKPRTADHYVGALAWALSWARDQGRTNADPLREWPRLYKVDRSHIIWTPADLEVICAHAEPDLQRAMLLAAYSGLRLGDLLKLTWTAIGQDVLTRRTSKRGRTVHVPIPPELQEVLDLCPRGGLYVATRQGQPWKVSTLEKRFGIARKAAGITGKRWHDFRGTYATLLFRAGLETSAVAQIMGWSKDKADEVARIYVTGEVIALAAVKRLKRFTAKSSSPTISKTETDGILQESSVKSKAITV